MPYALYPHEILQIAQEAVRQKGYVTYPDYEDTLLQVIGAGRLLAVDTGWELLGIKEVLLANGYQRQRVRRERARFYPTGPLDILANKLKVPEK